MKLISLVLAALHVAATYKTYMGHFQKMCTFGVRFFSKKLVFAFHLMLRLLRRKCIYELRKSHMQA